MSLADILAANDTTPQEEAGDLVTPDIAALPEYIRAANLHNIGNGNPTFDPTSDDSMMDSVGKFIKSSVYSGVNEFYNSGQWVGSWFGNDAQYRSTEEYLQQADPYLVDYYNENKDTVDVAGFVLSSLAPGLGGIKVLNMGQNALRASMATGRMSPAMSKAAGLLAPTRQKYVAQAISEMTSGTVFTTTNTNLIKALGAGAAQNFMEAAAFEVAAATALYKSPIFEHSDVSDIAWNIGIGTLLGGTIGTGITHLLDRGAVKAAVKQFNKEAAPWATLPGLRETVDPSDKIVLLLADRAAKGAPPTPEIARIWQRTNVERDLQIKEALYQLTGKDSDVTEILFHSIKDFDDVAALQSFGAAKQIRRMTGNLAAERELSRLAKLFAKDPLNDDLAAQVANLDSKVLGLVGEDAGQMVRGDKFPRRLADSLRANERIQVSGHTVTAGKTTIKFKPDEAFDVAAASDPLKVEARYILAERSGPLLPGSTIFEKDIPFLEKALREGTADIKVRTTTGYLKSFSGKEELFSYIKDVKERTAFELAQRAAKPTKTEPAGLQERFTQQEIAQMVNVRNSYLSGMRQGSDTENLFARSAYLQELQRRTGKATLQNFDDIPSYIKVGYKQEMLAGLDGNQLEGMALIMEKQKLQHQAVDRVAASALGSELFDTFIPLSQRDVLLADTYGAGRGMLSFSSGDPGSLASKVEYLGQRTTKAIIQKSDELKERITAPLWNLGQNTTAAREWAVIHSKIASSSEEYVFDSATNSIRLKKFVDFEAKVAEYKKAGKDVSKLTPPSVAEGVEAEFKIINQEVIEAMRSYVDETARQYGFQAALKLSKEVDPRVIYPVRPDPGRYKYFAFVRDDHVLGEGRTKMVYAQTEQDLATLVSEIEAKGPSHWTVYTKKDAERYYKSIGQFEFDKTLHDAYFDTEFKRRGIAAPVLVATDPTKIVDDTLNMLLRRERGLVRDVVAAKYEPQFNALRALGEQYTRIGTSKFGSQSLLDYAENTVKNPYADYVKTALGYAKQEEFKWWFGPQEFVDQAITSLADKLRVGVRAAKTTDDLLAINAEMQRYGYNGLAYDAVLEQLVNHTLPRSVLSDFGKKANAIMSALTLRTDWFNAANNIIGSHVLLYSQMDEIIKKLRVAAPDDLRQLAGVTVAGTDDWVVSPTKLHGNAIKAFWKDRLDPGSPLHKMFKQHGFITTITDQQRHVLDDLTLLGTETVQQANGRIAAAHSKATKMLEAAEKATGNLFAEEYNRFVAAHMAKELGELAVAKGVMHSDDLLPLINTFVNRTQGNYIASQRPALLQGPVGQLMGLFQTYQFTLLQNLLRNVSEGNVKTLALMAGLQGTIYGMNGMPAFNAINTYILGQAAGNPEFKDVHYHAYSVLNKDAAEWLMYGAAANLTGTNLYVRGDINPRQATVVPTTLEELPIYGGFAKTFNGLKTMLQGVEGGGDVWQSFLSGIEHGSVNRPLQGLAQVARGFSTPDATVYSTSAKGNIIYENDLLSLASLARLGGAKPFDEAVLRDLAVRTQAYESAQKARTEALYGAIKSTVRAGGVPTLDQLERFTSQFVNLGFDQEDFSKKVISLYQDTNTTQADRLAEELRSPAMQKLQQLMTAPDPTTSLYEGEL